MNAKERLAQADAKYQTEKERVNKLCNVLEQAKASCAEALAELQEAQKAADMELPLCVIVRNGFGQSEKRVNGCIVRRTQKTIFARPIGKNEEPEQYRLYKNGQWEQYPRATGWLKNDFLEFSEDSE